MNTPRHWDQIYAASPVEALSWYEEYPAPSLDLILRCDLQKSDPIIDVGAGATSLLTYLLEHGFRNVTVLDHSSTALRKLERRLPADQAQWVSFILADVLSTSWLDALGPVALWHDRALLHFMTADAERERYRERLRSLIKKGGYAVFGAFAPDGARQCSGLPVRRYSAARLSRWIGADFRLEESLHYPHTMPSGDTRPYVYARFRRLS